MTYFTKPFFTLVFAIADIYPLVILLDVIGIIMILFKEKFEPRTFVLWLMIIIVLPIAGFLSYLVLGCTLYSTKRFDRKAESDRRFLSDVPADSVHGLDMGDGLDYATRGNEVRAYWNLSDFYDDAVDDIRSSKGSVLVEIRRFPKGDFSIITDALSDAASRGVDVRIITGSYGFGRTRGIRDITSVGGRFTTFHNRAYSTFSMKNSYRVLRGIIVIDGSVAYSGAESVVRVEGPAASRLAKRFAADWSFSTGETFDIDVDPVHHGDDIVQITSGGPDVGGEGPPASEYMSMIMGAKERIYMTFEYLVPNEVLYNSMRLAVFSGAEVHLIIPRRGRHWYQAWNSLSASNELMLSGVHVYFTDKRTMRNVVVCDGRMCSVGSAVFNSRSMRYDFTTNVLAFSESLASQIEGFFREELASAVECHPEEYAGRSFSDKVKIVFSRMMMFFN